MVGVGKKQKKITAAGYLSEDILPEILKRLPIESLNRFKGVQKSWYHLIHSPHVKALHYNNHSFVYMLVRQPIVGFVLYRFHPLHHLQYNSDSTNSHDLLPLLVFPEYRYAMNFPLRCIKLGSKLYIYGIPNYSPPLYTEHDPRLSIYTIDERDLLDIQPSDGNIITKFKHILTRTANPMHGKKYTPTLFVANNKLYVLSHLFRKNMFEVFSPVHQSWQVLPHPDYDALDDFWLEVIYFVVVEQEQMVYFSTSISIMSFNLETHKWSIHSKTPVPFSHKINYDTSICVPMIRELAFRFLRVEDATYVCASRTYRGEVLSQPYLAPDKAFLEVLRSSRFTYISEDLSSENIIGLQNSDGTQVLCIVTYGSIPLDKKCGTDHKTNYVALSFFDIPGDFYTSEDRPLQEHDIDEIFTDDGGVFRYFNAKLRYTKHFTISTDVSFGEIESCFF